MSDGLKIFLGALVGTIVVLLFVSTLGGGGMMGGGLFDMLFALLFWAVLVVLLIALVVWIVNRSHWREKRSKGFSSRHGDLRVVKSSVWGNRVDAEIIP